MLIPVNGIEIACTERGSGDPFVLLHGYTGNATNWDGVLDELAAVRRVVLLEHRGHGGSTHTGDAATYTFDQLALDLAAAVDALDLARFDLLGHSMGGIVAMRYALGHPARVRSLVLMDTGAAASDNANTSGLMRGGLELARTDGVMAVYELLAGFLPDDESRVAMKRSFEQLDPVAFCTLGEELLTHPSVLDRLAGLDVPTTVLVGEHDTNLRGAADDLATTIPGASLVVIPDAGHSPQVENRDAWLAAVLTHLAVKV